MGLVGRRKFSLDTSEATSHRGERTVTFTGDEFFLEGAFFAVIRPAVDG